MKIVAFLPVKESSSRIDNKNTRLLDGKPLFLITLEKLINCSFIDEVYLDSESDRIFDMASELDFIKFKRDPNLATNKTDGNKLFLNEVDNIKADIYIQILCTSPFISEYTIEKGVNAIKSSDTYDSAVLVRKEKLYLWDNCSMKPYYDINRIPNSIDLPDSIIETMGLYIITYDAAKKTRRRIGENPYLLNATPLEAIDVNFPEDFELASLIAAGKREKERKLLSNLSAQLSSSILSDILDELQVKNKVITNLSLNMCDKKIFGRAKTLKIKKRVNDNESSIYEALKSYETIIPNDIIVVENEEENLAYFGELNANLAIRSGAVGVIVGGNTRDSEAVRKLGIPVFSKGYSCKDIKNNGAIESINKRIQISGVEIFYEDLIFGDNDGIVVIPKNIEKSVIERCFEIIRNERNILIDIASGVPIQEIRKKFGDF